MLTFKLIYIALTPDAGKVEFNFQRDGLRHAEIKDDYY